MKKFLVNGKRPLQGKVKASGAKNAALPILAATLLTNGVSTFYNVPNLNDVVTIIRVLRALGLRAEYYEPNTVKVWVNGSIKHVAPYELVTKMRASFFVLGPLLARKGLAKVPLPGGCAIGSRPVDLYLKGFENMGAKAHMEHGFVVLQTDRLKGAHVYLDFPSVGATESIMMAATLADGVTRIENAAREPEIADLARYLNLAGAKIKGAGDEAIEVEGVSKLSGCEHSIISDRIETGTFMIAGAMTGGDVTVEDTQPAFVEPLTSKLREAGVDVEVDNDKIRVKSSSRVKAVDIKTMPYPGFPTDLQPQFLSLMSLADGTSVITETIFENRFMHVQELKRMGALIKLEGKNAIIKGVTDLSSAPVRAYDLRGGAALVIAALSASGETLIEDADHHIGRGYEKFEEKMNALGADFREVKSENNNQSGQER